MKAAEIPAGHFSGSVEIDGQRHEGDALVAADGTIRLHVGGDPAPPSGGPVVPDGSGAQFVGRLAADGGTVSGSGELLAQDCTQASRVARCGEAMAATITVVPTVTPGAFKAEIRIHSTQGDRVWRVDMGSWHNYFVLPARLPRIAVRYGEAEAEFGTGGDMTITVDASGTLSFRSTQTGCVGLGTVAPYGDGRNQIYEVRLDVSDCAGSRAYLVGRYSGLATSAPSDPWNYDSNLRMWLSSTDAGRPVAVTTWGLMEY